ncbi:helix-turn-helix transcriptional regulator [Mucilaginibacter myungsuensis]|uniref:Helix-turn-helix transcriptional regulator n=1 Tax=Mucilaginibacter myungsuensis TaxID=649104 RepID=A0A929KZU3_9SPHI|nr:helix-turn-helix transcriptional regulator [Mucilaginibacter myungsuensis]MBE9662993.1 helix-turn-helix transcriptional regulator [Mucilaginibacter myungsuensis]MDN3598623.1 helix-turn-helix transcriptional regulator [Mucilaginibacter myungsuensis]
MSTATDSPKNIHQGRNVKRFREMLGLKQEALALALGDDWSQKRVSLLEGKELIEEDILAQVAAILKVPVEAIKNFDEEKAIYNIQNNYEGSSSNYSGLYQCTFNPLDKLIELVEENKKLYEQLLASEREKVEILKGKSNS